MGDGGDYEAVAADAIKDGIRSAADDELPDAGLRPEVSGSFASRRLVAGLRRMLRVALRVFAMNTG